MMLRNRDLNVQKNVEQPQQLQQNQKRKFQQDQNEKPNKQEAVLPIKRPPAHLVVNGDITAVEEYVQDIFIYYKNRERHFIVSDYMKRQPNLTPSMRAQLVDWIVDMQETLEFYHETLYLAVKLFDLFMDRTKRIVQREKLQLVAAIALFVSAKFDERTVPLIDDLIYLSGDTFTEDEFIKMEREFLTTVSFDLGAPLSYRFLRRLSRVSETTNMDTLTLARYVLELSLLSLQFCRQPESLMAAACFLLAKRIRADEVGNAMDDQWEPNVQASCGYTLAEVEPLMWALNRMLAQRGTKLAKYETIYKKYSHEIFFCVAKCIPLDDNKRKS